MTADEAASDLFVRDEPQQAGLGLVFGNCDPELSQQRARQAAALYQLGFVPRLLLSGGAGATADGTPEAERMARKLIALGVPEEALLLEARSRNTHENVKNALALLRDAGLLPIRRPPVPGAGRHPGRRSRRGGPVPAGTPRRVWPGSPAIPGRCAGRTRSGGTGPRRRASSTGRSGWRGGPVFPPWRPRGDQAPPSAG